MADSSTKFVEEQIKPLTQELWSVMQHVQALQNAYNALGGEEFIKKNFGGGQVLDGFIDLTGDDVISAVVTVNAIVEMWKAGHADNIAKAYFKK